MELMDYIEQVKAERAERRAEKREELLEKLESGQKEIARRMESRISELSVKNRFFRKRLLDAFPNMRSIGTNRLGPLKGRGQAEKEQKQPVRAAWTAFLVWERLFSFW